jgi:hypothetical protein
MTSNGAGGAAGGGNQREIFTRLGPIAEGYTEFKNTVFNWFNPPLRTNDDLKAVIRGLQQDIIDHPWNAFERERSPPNLVGAPGRFGIINKDPQNDLYGPRGAGGAGGAGGIAGIIRLAVGAAPIERNEIIVRMNHHPTIQGEWINTGRSYTGGSSRAPPAQYECPPPTVCHKWKLELHPNGQLYAKYLPGQPAHNAFERKAQGRFISFDQMEKILQHRNIGRLRYVMDHMNNSAHAARGAELGLWEGPLPQPTGGPQYLPEQSPIGNTLAKFLGGHLPPFRYGPAKAGTERSRRSKRKARKTQKNRHK